MGPAAVGWFPLARGLPQVSFAARPPQTTGGSPWFSAGGGELSTSETERDPAVAGAPPPLHAIIGA